MDADSQGFLIGTRVALSEQSTALDRIRIDVTAIRRAIAVGRTARGTQRTAEPRKGAATIRPEDVRLVAAVLGAKLGGSSRVSQPAARDAGPSARAAAAMARERDAQGRFLPGAAKPNPQERAQAKAQAVDAAKAQAKAMHAEERKRSTNGRFAAGDKSGDPTKDDADEKGAKGGKGRGGSDGAGDAVKRAVEEVDVQRIDPIIESLRAFKPILTVAKPLGGKLWERITRKSADTQVGWLKKIFAALTKKAAGSTFDNAEAGKAGGEGLFASLLGALPFAGRLKGVAGAAGALLPALGGMARTAGGGVAAAGGGLSRLLGGGARALGRTPWIGAALGLGGYAMNAAAIDSGPMDEESRRRAHFRNGATTTGSVGGALGGSILGGMIGAAGGPLGVVAGSAIGGFLGESLGESMGSAFADWVDSLRDSDLIASVTTKFVEWFKGLGEAIKRTIRGAVKAVTEPVKAGANKAADWVDKVIPGSGRALKSLFGIEEGAVSREFEGGARLGAGAISSGAGDAGGKSYGVYQLSSNRGMVEKFLGQSMYGEHFKGLKVGTPEFDAKWREVAAADPEGFAKAQHAFIKSNNVTPAAEALAGVGHDLMGRGEGVRQMLFSTAVQHGAGGATELIGRALGMDSSKMSDEEVIKAVQGYKAANVGSHFRSSSTAVQDSVRRRIGDETATLLGMPAAAASASSPMPGSAPRVTVPGAPASPDVSSAPRDRETVNVKVDMPRADVGQNVGDRMLAHAITGGIGTPV